MPYEQVEGIMGYFDPALPIHRQEFLERTRVTFKPLKRPEIAHYLTLINPLDKAGSYAAQEHGEVIIEKVDGPYSNVVGLPIERLLRELKALGVI